MKKDEKLKTIVTTLKYVRRFAQKTVLIKIGGAVLNENFFLDNLCQDLIALQAVGISVVLVHGGGASINVELSRRGISWDFKNGLRRTTPEMMDVIEMVLVGSINRILVRHLSKNGIFALGLSGADNNLFLCSPLSAELERVGRIEDVKTHLISATLASLEPKILPVIAPVGVGINGEAYNINADWAASFLAVALNATKLIFLTDQDGILSPDGSVYPDLDAGELQELIEKKVVLGGMLTKAKTIIHALKSKIPAVHVLNARKPHTLIEELFTESGSGTICKLPTRNNAIYRSID